MKKFIFSLFAITFFTLPAIAQNSLFDETAQAETVTNEQIDPNVKKYIQISPEELVLMEAPMQRSIEYDINNTTPRDVHYQVKFNNYINKLSAENDGGEFRDIIIDSKDRKQVREFYEQFKPTLESR